MIDAFKIAQDRRDAAVTAIRDALTLEDAAVWPEVSRVLAVRLSEDELAVLALSALHALPDEYAVSVTQQHLSEVAGSPDSWLGSSQRWDTALQSARDWARGVSQLDLKAYATASIERMPPKTRFRLKSWLEGAR